MTTVVSVVDEQREPLLCNSSAQVPTGVPTDGREEEIVPVAPPDELTDPKPNLGGSSPRLVSLDVFRGLTVALMILVDEAGGAFPSINHSPWFGVTLADFVMPFFLFGVGFSISLVFKLVLTIACSILVYSSSLGMHESTIMGGLYMNPPGGVLISYLSAAKSSKQNSGNKESYTEDNQALSVGRPSARTGGYIHGGDDLTYGVDMAKIRWLGILQRISIGYLLASLSEIWLVNKVMVDNPMAFMKKYYIQWMAALVLLSSYMSLLYGLYVPNWEFKVPGVDLFIHEADTQTVHCGVRGSLEPPCNAAGYIDRIILGEQHLYQHPVYRRTKECSVNSPDYGPLPPNSPIWCLAPFDPEGILSSLMASITCFMGLYFGHLSLHWKGQTKRMLLWSISSVFLLISGYCLKMLGMPFCKPLYTFSYMCITAGASGLLLTVLFYIVDVKLIRKPTVLLQWMGMNALIVYALATTNIIPAAVRGFYWQSPQNNLISFFARHLEHRTERLLRAMLIARKWGTLGLVMLEILCWSLFAGYLHIKGIYIKL